MRRLHVLLLASVLTPFAAYAQYTAGNLVFNGAPADQQAALEQTIALKPGQHFSTADLQAAAQRLSDTGAFDDVQVAVDGPAQSISVIFTLKPLPAAAKLVTSFENFYWFTPEELQAGLRKRVPLSGPTLPEAGNLIDATQAALEDLLREHSITAKVRHSIDDPSLEQQARIVNFFVSTPGIIIGSIHLSGVSPKFADDVRFWSKRVSGSLLNDGLEHRTTDTRLLIPYLNSGYVQAHLADRKLTPITTAPDKVVLDLAGTVVPGPLLHVGTVTWAGSPLLSSAAFAQTAPLKSGDLAALNNLEKTTDALAAPYRQQGYADVLVTTATSVDAAAGIINYTFTVAPGEQYRIRSIKTDGFSAQQQADFDRTFTMKKGNLFNPDYLLHFFGKESASPSFRYNSGSYRAERDPVAHLVDVTVTLAPAPVEPPA